MTDLTPVPIERTASAAHLASIGLLSAEELADLAHATVVRLGASTWTLADLAVLVDFARAAGVPFTIELGGVTELVFERP